MKKIFMLGAIILFVIAFSFTSFAKEEIKPLSDIGIFEKDVYEEKYVTLNELCLISAKLLNPEIEIAENMQEVYQQYVSMFKSSGLVDSQKNGEMYVTGEDVSKLYVYALGYYDAAVSSQKTFTEFARTLGLIGSSQITCEGEVNYAMLTKMTYKLLTKPMAEISIEGSGKITTTHSNTRTLLSDVFEISVYEGTVESVNSKPYSATVSIKRNVYEQNQTVLSGTSVSFQCANNVDLNAVENAPSVIWVKDGKIVSAFLKENSEISFGVVLSVNDNEDEDAKYVSENFKELMFYDDKKEYKIADDFKIKSDGVILDSYTPVCVVGKYVRIIKTDNKISFIELWSFSEGGLITEIEKTTTETIIHYINKTVSNTRFKKLKDYENIKVIINGKYSDVSSIKPNSVFSWCAYGETLVIAINEKVVSERFNSVSIDYAEIGKVNYLRNKTVYVSKNSTKFSDTYKDMTSMLSNDVSAYFDITNRVSYITPVKNAPVNSSVFIGLVTGYYYEAFEEKREIEILCLERDLQRKSYAVRKKAVLSDGITYSDIESAISLNDGSAIYEFTVNSQNEVTEIKNACTYKGIGSHIINLGNFNNNSSIPSFTSSDGSDMYVHNTPIIVIYKDLKGKYVAKKEEWINMYDKNADGCKAYVYGYENNSDPKLIVISGKTENICTFNESNGIITNKSVVIDENGEQKCKITVLTSRNEQDYYLPLEEGKNLPQRAYITFKNNFRYDFSRTIKISSFSDLTSSFENWQMTSFNPATVKMKGEFTFMTEDEKTCFLHPYYCFVVVYENDELKKGDMSDIYPGDSIYYYYTGGAVRMIFVEKN